MELAAGIGLLTGLGVCTCVMLCPEVRLGRFRIGSYWLVSLVGALCMLLLGVVPLSQVLTGLTADSAINPLKILALFLSMTMLSVYLDEWGLFSYLAGRVLARGHGGQNALFLRLYMVVAVLTVFTSNDIIILTFTPFICCFARRAGIDPLPYLFAEFFAANTWSMLLVIGNPTNIYLATAAGIDFFAYCRVMALPALVGGGVSLLLLWLLFRRRLAQPLRPQAGEVQPLCRLPVGVGVFHLLLCILLLAISSYTGWEMWLITVVLAASLLLFALCYAGTGRGRGGALVRTLRRLPYALVPFVLSMFVLVLALSYTGVTAHLAAWLSGFDPLWSVGLSAYLSANMINNIPMSVLFSTILQDGAFAGAAALRGIYAAIAASNIGACLTPVGALAGIMWLSILKRSGVRLSFGTFVRYGLLVSLPVLLVVCLSLGLVLG